MLNFYGDPATDAAVLAERALLAELHDGCSVLVGAYAMPAGDGLKLTAQVTSLDGTQRVFASATGADARLLGESLACTSRARRRSCGRSGRRSNGGFGRCRRRRR